jgi:hypothetical protein
MPGETPSDPYSGTHIDQAEGLAKMQFSAFLRTTRPDYIMRHQLAC